MKIFKIRFRNKIEDDFLRDYVTIYIEKEITTNFSTNAIIDEFYSMKLGQAQLV